MRKPNCTKDKQDTILYYLYCVMSYVIHMHTYEPRELTYSFLLDNEQPQFCINCNTIMIQMYYNSKTAASKLY